MTDLTVQDLLACFALEDRQALEDVAHDGLGRWVADHSGSLFQVRFADTCLVLTGFDKDRTEFLVNFEDVRLAARTRGSLHNLKKIPCLTST